FTAVILSPSKVTWTCTGPFSVVTVVPLTTVPDDEPDPDDEAEEEADGVEAASVVDVLPPRDGS
ncbi:hypothetical protein ABZ835_10725, partial [Streptomyces sp. NPDC047461]|uniref:hypothetical protein n=1 Tax=Streptomyces sp. NPDC047461 TaxID=3155619 RepID=UPI0033C19532